MGLCLVLSPVRVLFPIKVPGSGRFQLSDLAVLGYGLGFWVVFVIAIVVPKLHLG